MYVSLCISKFSEAQIIYKLIHGHCQDIDGFHCQCLCSSGTNMEDAEEKHAGEETETYFFSVLDKVEGLV